MATEKEKDQLRHQGGGVLNQPVADPNVPFGVTAEEDMPHVFTPKELEGKKGDLKPGEMGWIALNEDGDPTGSATRDPPKDQPAARVVYRPPFEHAELTTPSGAPITDQMNPEPVANDEGFLARNPPGGTATESKVKPPEGPYTGGKTHPAGRNPELLKK